MKKVILNADDLGLSPNTNQGIISSITEGIVTSTTAMMNMPYAKEGIYELKALECDGIGVHLNISEGSPSLPLREVKSLVNKDGNFKNKKIWRVINKVPYPLKKFTYVLLGIKLDEVEKEFRNQINLFIEMGFTPSHLDSHHSIHMHDEILKIAIKLAYEFNLPLRCTKIEKKRFYVEKNIITTDEFTGVFAGDKIKADVIKDVINNQKGETLEIMVHPAALYNDNLDRAKELDVLTSPSLIEWIKESNVKMINFNNL